MGCIEICLYHVFGHQALRLIETWDVLKSFPAMPLNLFERINRNMGCIEITNM